MNRPVPVTTSDGWRGIVGREFSSDFVQEVAQNLLHYSEDRGWSLGRGIAVGYDTRLGSEEAAEIVSDVASSFGLPVHLCASPTPSPLVSCYAASRNLSVAVIITASHYPSEYNGIKLRLEGGRPPTAEELSVFFQRSGTPSFWRSTRRRGRITRVDLREWYSRFLRTRLPVFFGHLLDMNPQRPVVVDVMHGTTAGVLSQILSGSGWDIREIRTAAAPDFGGARPDPIEPLCETLRHEVESCSASVGIAFDGDGDRIGIIDPVRGYVGRHESPGLVLLSALAQQELAPEERWSKSRIVKTFPVTQRVDQIAEAEGISVVEVPVGFRDVYLGMVEVGAGLAFGDDSSVAFAMHQGKDSILAALCLLAQLDDGLISHRLSALERRFGPLSYRKNNLRWVRGSDTAHVRDAVVVGLREMGCSQLLQFRDGIKAVFGSGWLAIRFSGTEDYIRVYSEAPSSEEASEHLDCVCALLRPHLTEPVIDQPYTELN